MKGVFIMSYEKQTWVTGEVITAPKLNHMEGGIEALSKEYDFIVYYNVNDESTPPISISALGISPDDLFDKIAENGIIKTVCIGTNTDSQGYLYILPSYCIRYINDVSHEIKILEFTYNELGDGDKPNIAITDGGLARSGLTEGTYTYSNGEYEFTFSSEPPQ